MKYLLTAAILLMYVCTEAQVKIGDNPSTINANSLLELESTNKGFLPPRVALNSISSVSPMSGTVTAGMLVYSTGGTLLDGYYYWNGTEWKRFENGLKNLVIKTASATLTKTETYVLASNDITLTLPVVTSADNGLEITVKHMGVHTDLVTVIGNGGATIDAGTSFNLHRWDGITFVVNGANWIIKRKENIPDNLMDVNSEGSWTTIQEAMEYLAVHMDGPTVIRLGAQTYNIPSTIVINLPFAVTIQGLSYGTSTIAAATGLAGKPMFRCLSDCYFKMLQFDATTLTGYGTAANEDAIRLLGSGTYNEIKDCTFDRFYNTILDSSNAELWLFESDISNAQRNGILIHGGVDSVTVKVAQTDFIGCARGINLSKGNKATIQLESGGYYNVASTDTAILYKPATFTSMISVAIKGNSWNNTGKYIEGFDFSRSDGRDANVIMESNAGIGDKKPYSHITVLNSATTTTLTTTNTWYKVAWNNTLTTFTTSKWTITNASGNVNRITYQPLNRRDGYFIISGNLSCSATNSTISIGIVKNGASGTRYGETTLRTANSGTASQFTTVVYLSDIAPGDYFELWASTTTGGDIITMLDLLWLAQTQ